MFDKFLFGNKQIPEMYFGNIPVAQIYFGNTLVWEKSVVNKILADFDGHVLMKYTPNANTTLSSIGVVCSNNGTYYRCVYVFDNNGILIAKETNENIIRPYIVDGVKVYRYFYDFESDDEKKQMDSLIVYGETYMQNTGVDYSSDEIFDSLIELLK